VERSGSPREFLLSGELDLATVDGAADELASAVVEDGDLSLDLASVSFIDSSGIRLLLQIYRTLQGRGRLILVSPQGQVADLLRLMGLTRVDGVEVIRPGAQEGG
jgi:anti-sigma B factor antagonist